MTRPAKILARDSNRPHGGKTQIGIGAGGVTTGSPDFTNIVAINRELNRTHFNSLFSLSQDRLVQRSKGSNCSPLIVDFVISGQMSTPIGWGLPTGWSILQEREVCVFDLANQSTRCQIINIVGYNPLRIAVVSALSVGVERVN